LSPDDDVTNAAELMENKEIRRLVMKDDRVDKQRKSVFPAWFDSG